MIALTAGPLQACAAGTHPQTGNLIVADIVNASGREDIALELTGEPRVIKGSGDGPIDSSGQQAGFPLSGDGLAELRIYRLLVAEELRLSRQGVPAPFLRTEGQTGLWCAASGYGSDPDLSTFCPTADPWFVPPLQREAVIFELVLDRDLPAGQHWRCEALIWGLVPGIGGISDAGGVGHGPPVAVAPGIGTAIGVAITSGAIGSTFRMEPAGEAGFVGQETGAVAATKGNRFSIFAPRSEVEEWESVRGSVSCESDQGSEPWNGALGGSTALSHFSIDGLGLMTMALSPPIDQ